KPDKLLYNESPEIKIYSLGLSRNLQMKESKDLSKTVYFKAIKQVKEIIKLLKPDILHAHYASSYGLIGALTGFHPYIISVWGADIYHFPNYSFIHKGIIKYNLQKADKILSTSKVMKEEIKKYTHKEICVTPFGIDVERFLPKKVNSLFNSNSLVIGTIKALEKKYGIEYLIKAFRILKDDFPDKSLKLLIVGKGSQEIYLKNIVKEFNLENDTIFTGYIKPEEIPEYHNMLDIFVSVSIDKSESFGVAVLEAGACGKPVVVSNIGGLPEVVDHEKTGYIVEPQNHIDLSNALKKLIINSRLRNKLGENGRAKVVKEYNWVNCVNQMISIYQEML